MSFGSFFKKLFGHFDAKHFAGALVAAQHTIDTIAPLYHWDWLPQFDGAVNDAVTALNMWQKGQPTVQIQQSLNLAVSILNNVEGLDAHQKAVIGTFVAAAEAALAFIG